MKKTINPEIQRKIETLLARNDDCSDDPPVRGYCVWEDTVTGESVRHPVCDPSDMLRWLKDEDQVGFDYDDASWGEHIKVMEEHKNKTLSPETRRAWERAEGYGSESDPEEWGDLDDGLTGAQRLEWWKEAGYDSEWEEEQEEQEEEEEEEEEKDKIPLDKKGRPTRTPDGFRIAGWTIWENSKSGRTEEIPHVDPDDVRKHLEEQRRDYGSTPEGSDDDFWDPQYVSMRYESAEDSKVEKEDYDHSKHAESPEALRRRKEEHAARVRVDHANWGLNHQAMERLDKRLDQSYQEQDGGGYDSCDEADAYR